MIVKPRRSTHQRYVESLGGGDHMTHFCCAWEVEKKKSLSLTHTIYLTGFIFLYGRLVEYLVQSSKTIRKLGSFGTCVFLHS